MLVKIDVLGVKQKVRKGIKRFSGPNTDFAGQTKRGGGRADLKNAGVKKFIFYMDPRGEKRKWRINPQGVGEF